MNNSRTTRTFVAVGLALSMTLGLSACGKAAEKVSEKMAEKAAEKAAGGDANVNIDSKDGSLKIETDDGSFSMGSAADVPADWPSDIPLPDGFSPEGHANMSADGETSITLTGYTDMSPDDAMAFYVDALSSWENEGNTSASNNGYAQTTGSFRDGTRTVMVSASTSADDDHDGTMLSFMYMVQPESEG